MSTGRGFFGELKTLGDKECSKYRCTYGRTVINDYDCGEPAVVIYEGWGSQTTSMPPYQPRCERHRHNCPEDAIEVDPATVPESFQGPRQD